jgi:hypothetical protein
MTTRTFDVAGLECRRVGLTSAQLEQLSSQIDGPLLTAGDEGWDEATLIWNAMITKTPALVAQPTSAQDVAAAVRFAAEHGLLLSVKGGGHNIAGTAIAEGGLTLDMSRMRDVTVDPTARLAYVGPGCLLKDVDRATQDHGLATVLGFVSETGVAGLTLGGGFDLPGTHHFGAPRADGGGDDPPRPAGAVRSGGVAPQARRRVARVPQRPNCRGRSRTCPRSRGADLQPHW